MEQSLIIPNYRDLDRLIATEVMGWTDVSRISWTHDGEIFETPIIHGKPFRSYTKHTVPYYSTNIRDCSDIIELLENSHYVEITISPRSGTGGRLTTVSVTALDIDYHDSRNIIMGEAYHAEDTSYCVAVCLAALKCIRQSNDITFSAARLKEPEDPPVSDWIGIDSEPST